VGKLALSTAADAITFPTGQVSDPTLLLAPYLQPLQAYLGHCLAYVHQLQGILCWHDPTLTTGLAILLALLACLLPLLPWRALCHTSGALALGPHWWLIGSRRRLRAARAAAAEAVMLSRYAGASSDEGRRAVLEEERRRRVESERSAHEASERSSAQRPFAGQRARRMAHFQQEALTGAVRLLQCNGAHVVEARLGLLSTPDPSRSFASPRPEARPDQLYGNAQPIRSRHTPTMWMRQLHW
jgi:hypothetical protein